MPHCKPAPWPMNLSHDVSIDGRYSSSKSSGSWTSFLSDDSPLPPGLSLRFFAETNFPKPFEVYWQVVNTGREATERNQLRGGIEKATTFGSGGLQSTATKAMRDERTEYRGMHWVECFIILDGICRARSGPFVVNID